MTETISAALGRANRHSPWYWTFAGAVALAIWFVLYFQLPLFADFVAALLPMPDDKPLKEAIRFFIYDTPKLFLLLILIVFAMGIVRSYFSPERTRALLNGKNALAGNVLAACLGIVTPFCTCSAVPLFIGFLSAGIPLGVTFSFLIAAPMINEVALGLLFGLVGWKVAFAYLSFGLALAIVSGWVIGRLNLESWLVAWVRRSRAKTPVPSVRLTVPDRINAGLYAVRDIVGKVWPWIIAGVGAGTFIHGYVPTDILASVMGKEAWWSVPVAVLVGVPLYSNHAGIIPVVEALLGKGAALGTVLAFMMSTTALSLPEAIILRKVLSWRLIGVFFGIVATGILMIGYLFNLLFI